MAATAGNGGRERYPGRRWSATGLGFCTRVDDWGAAVGEGGVTRFEGSMPAWTWRTKPQLCTTVAHNFDRLATSLGAPADGSSPRNLIKNAVGLGQRIAARSVRSVKSMIFHFGFFACPRFTPARKGIARHLDRKNAHTCEKWRIENHRLHRLHRCPLSFRHRKAGCRLRLYPRTRSVALRFQSEALSFRAPPHFGSCRLQAVQTIYSALCMMRGGEDCAVVSLQHREPGVDICGVVLANLRRQVEVGT